MIALLSATALATTVTLHVGVHREAGTAWNIVAENTSGQCVVSHSRLTCPAERGAVTFRWGPEENDWVLTGDTRLSPGSSGVAWVLAPDARRGPERERLTSRDLLPSEVRLMFIRNGTYEPSPPSWGMYQDLIPLLAHTDPKMRQAAVESLEPWISGAPRSMLPPTAPMPLPSGLLKKASGDEERRVRAAVARSTRDIRPSHLDDEVRAILESLKDDETPQVQRAALASLPLVSQRDQVSPVKSWSWAIDAVPRPKGPGRVACNTLARLQKQLRPGPTVDPVQAVELCLSYHPGRAWRVWSAWRFEVPFRPEWAATLIRETSAVSSGLVRYWGKHYPEDLARIVAEWEPSPPHSERFYAMQVALWETEEPALRTALDLPETGVQSPYEDEKERWSERVSIPWEKIRQGK